MRWRQWIAFDIERLEATRPASVLTIVAVLLFELTWLLLLWAFLLSSTMIAAIEEATHGLAQFTLIVSLVGLGPTLAIMACLGKLRPRDVGLRARPLIAGVILVAAMWLVAQIALVVAAVVSGHGVAWASTLRPELIGRMIAQLFGNALHEEIVFRGFLLVQLALLAKRVVRSRVAWVIAILASQTIFALAHIPHRWVMLDMHGAALLENLAYLAWFGVLYALAYLRTGNLGLCIALHALSNIHVALVESPLYIGLAMDGVTIAVLAAWPRLVRVAPSLRS